MGIARWYLLLAEFNYQVEHKPGRENAIADALSESEAIDSSWTDHFVASIMTSGGFTRDELVAEIRKDNQLSKVQQATTSGWTRAEVKDPDLKAFVPIREEVSVIQGILARGNSCVVPPALRQRALQLAHEGHSGIVKTSNA